MTRPAKPRLARRLFFLLTLTACALVLALPAAATDKDLQAAQDSALAWLSLIDQGQYARSWQETGQSFQKAVRRDSWVKTISAIRAPLGKAAGRIISAAKSEKNPPGAPQGQYMLMRLQSSYANKKTALETLTLAKEPQRGWRVVGYFIK